MKQENIYQTFQQKRSKAGFGLIVKKNEHKGSDVTTIWSVEDRKLILLRNKLWFQCTSDNYRASDCRSTCLACQKSTFKPLTTISNGQILHSKSRLMQLNVAP